MTTRRLVLIRHAKAVPAAADDAARDLDRRGERAAAAIGRWLVSARLTPDRAVVSPARRTRQTWALAAAATGATKATEPTIDRRLYDNTVDDLLAVLAETPPDVATLALVGHNPSVQELAVVLDDGSSGAGNNDAGSATGRRELREKYPTAGIAVFRLGADWADVGARSATLQTFTVARG